MSAAFPFLRFFSPQLRLNRFFFGVSNDLSQQANSPFFFFLVEPVFAGDPFPEVLDAPPPLGKAAFPFVFLFIRLFPG